MYGEKMYLFPELLKAHQQNDKAAMQAYDFDIKTTTESSCVAELMKIYQALTEKKAYSRCVAWQISQKRTQSAQ